ncbi:hypothetical protein PVAP13_2NG123006 [Panicum virgatum]|uniref:DUF4220 domain-containing protein n=1 Tax=Panicum virgatum TaxID=38727 RepID=A0A8T0V8K6_PANVG|nr:hypothetical protein PVAP13_2NG123006 [Panicum virgatum]
MLCRALLSSGGAVAIPFALRATTAASSHWLGVRASCAAGHPGPSKVVADYMKQHGGATCTTSPDGGGCRYLVRWPAHRVARRGKRSSSSSSSAAYRCELPEDDVITVDTIWEHCDGEGAAAFASLGVSGSRIRGACLAYSLSHLLKRRLFGLDCAEAGLAETRRFVLDGLLSEDNADEHTEAFRTTFFSTAVLKIILASVLGVLVLLQHTPITDESTVRTVDVVATVLVLGAFVAAEASQTVMYLGSDWAMVSLACCRLPAGANRFLPFALRKPSGFLCRRPMFRSWHKSLGQYSVIESSRFLRSSKASCSFETTEFEPMVVFSATAEYLRRAWGNLTTSKALQRNGVSRQLSWTLQNETQAESMLIWHIATEYLIIALPDEEATGSSRHREVATKLSRYCAYLMSEAPELLPGNSVDTKFILDRAMLEAREALGSGSELRGRDRLRKVGTGSGDAAGTIFTRGLKLGAKLESIREGSLRWKLMAEFWVETILFVAPSDNAAAAHMERLVRGGEL